ncbi:MAG: sulfite exporter TauE/SafE family protein [Pseudomonas sp.]|uniref:sulfite exporter TauE/SafE family protein n=1 Tax=Pseudomonas abieticivorans TaxID=2931382 RepID=UPI0020BEACAC|nr:sulfite exporter TauE/SafE family protein [Pseudomonas sp. PIA16]MDE1167938.1 sulfite exporter TauE/SafE family protein [Pseudomonas sp.]
MTLALTFGLLIGVVLGLTGAGGGILAVPALVLGLGWSMTQAAPVALFAVGAAAAVGAIDGLRKGLVRWRAALLMALLGSLFTPLGLYFAHRLPEALLMVLFCAVLVIVAWRMLSQVRGDHGTGIDHGWQQKNCMLDPSTGRLKWTVRCSATLAVVGACCGFLTGLLGVGGGFLLVPAFRQLSDIRLHGIIATSLMVIALVSGMAILGALHAGVRIPAEGFVFIGASIAGMVAGRAVSAKVPAKGLQCGFAGLCVAVAVYLLVHLAAG